MNKFRDLTHNISIFLLNKIFIYFINIIILSYHFIFLILSFYVKFIIDDYSFNFLLMNLI